MAVTNEALEQIQRASHEMFAYMERREAERATEDQARQETLNTITKISDRITELENKGRRPLAGGLASRDHGPSPEQEERKRVLLQYVRVGYSRLPAGDRELLHGMTTEAPDGMKAVYDVLRTETKAFSIADETLGGYFVLPEIIEGDIIKASVLFSPVRELARVVQTKANSVRLPVRTSTLTAGWVGETAQRVESAGQAYGQREIPTFEMYALSLFSRQLIEDEYFNLEAELQGDIAEQFGVVEGTAFVNGSGAQQPKGFLQETGLKVQVAAGAAAVTYQDLVKAFHQLKPAYRNSPNCKWVFNQTTLGAIRSIVDTQGRPIFQPLSDSGLAGANPSTIMGKPYVEAVDMPDIATGQRAIAVGDFARGYRFVDRVGMTVQRLDQIYALTGQVGLLMHKRVGGMVVLPEAIAVLQQA